MTRIVTVAKAAGIANEETQSVAIDISETLPPMHALPDLAAWDAYLDEQATKIEEALHAALPGGTYHHLLVKMLERKTCLLRVTHK